MMVSSLFGINPRDKVWFLDETEKKERKTTPSTTTTTTTYDSMAFLAKIKKIQLQPMHIRTKKLDQTQAIIAYETIF